MTLEELREACVLAGLRLVKHPSFDCYGIEVDGTVIYIGRQDADAWIKAYVASLLVARIWATRHHEGKTEIDRYLDSFDTNDCAEFFATDTQRLRAAVKVLKP